jgi:hypothetical protein
MNEWQRKRRKKVQRKCEGRREEKTMENDKKERKIVERKKVRERKCVGRVRERKEERNRKWRKKKLYEKTKKKVKGERERDANYK